MAHVCEDDGSATTFVVAALPLAARAPIAAPRQWPAVARADDVARDTAPRLDRATPHPAERLKPAA